MTERFLQSAAPGRLATVLTYTGSGYGSGFASAAVDSSLHRKQFNLGEIGTVIGDAHKGGIFGAATGGILGAFAPRMEGKTAHHDVEKINDAAKPGAKTATERPPSWVISFRARDELGNIIPDAIAVKPTLFRFGSKDQVFPRSPERFLKEVAVAAARSGNSVIIYKHGAMNSPFEAARDASLVRAGATSGTGGKGPAVVAIDVPTGDHKAVGYLEFLPRIMEDLENSRHLHPKIIEAAKDVIELIRSKELKATVIGHSVGTEGAVRLAEHMTKKGIKVDVVTANPHLTDGTIAGPAAGINGEIHVLNGKDNAARLAEFAQKRLVRRFFELAYGKPWTTYFDPKEILPERAIFKSAPTTDRFGHSPDMNALGRYAATLRDNGASGKLAVEVTPSAH
jgi:pimeloyl-ACP methyl ester carboxylesterase